MNDAYMEVIDDEQLTEQELNAMSNNELLICAGNALRGFVDERWQDAHGLTWQLKVLNEINHREGNGQ
jgi:hypothetical protein